MKHYRIGIEASHHRFEYLCSTISEAYGAIEDAVSTFGLKIDMNKIMEKLVDMDRGITSSSYGQGLWISIEDGEV